MPKKQLVDNIEVILENKNGIALIEKLFLNLAVNGKLQTLASEFESAEVRKLGEVCDLYQPKTISTAQLIPAGKYPVYGANGVIGNFDEFNHEESEVLVTCRGATCGTVNISQPFSWINGNAMVVRPKNGSLRKDFLALVLRSIDYERVITGTAQPQITKTPLANVQILIPKLAAQALVVNYMDSLYELLSDLRSTTIKLQTLKSSFCNSTIDSISRAQTKDEFSTAWNRVQQNWDVITRTPKGIESLRDLIRSLAIRGNLTGKSLPKSHAGRQLGEVGKKLNQHTALSIPAVSDNSSDCIPDSWRKSTLGAEVEIIRGVTFPSSAKYREPSEGRIACLRTTNVQKQVDWTDLLYIPENFIKSESQYVRRNDILISMANSKELVGKVSLVTRDDVRCTLGGFIAAIRCGGDLLPEFLMIILRAPATKEMLIDSSTQTTNIANISLGRLRPLEICIPPLVEQIEIVQRVTKLFDLCDELENLILARTQLTEKFARSVVTQSE